VLGRTKPRNPFQPAFVGKPDDRMGKSSPNLTKICRHDHKGLVNTSTEGIDELLHGLGEIDEIRGKIGVFTRTPKPQIEGTRESEGFRTRIEGLEAPQGITKTSRINLSTRAQDPTKENRIHPKTKDKACEIDLLPKPRRAQGGLGLLSRSISVQELKNSSPTSLA